MIWEEFLELNKQLRMTGARQYKLFRIKGNGVEVLAHDGERTIQIPAMDLINIVLNLQGYIEYVYKLKELRGVWK